MQKITLAEPLKKRLCKHGDFETIYHYCPPEAFLSICQNKTIRLSDIYSMNDYMEGSHGFSIFQQIFKFKLENLKNENSKNYYKKQDIYLKTLEIWKKMNVTILPMAACFSKSPDQLSQWRAYTENGKGYSIGFKAEYFFKKQISCFKKTYISSILYNIEEQKKEIEYFVDEILNTKEYDEKEIVNTLNQLMHYSFQIKNNAFEEEKEIRLLSNILINHQENGDIFIDKNSNDIKFRMRDSRPSAYIDIDFTEEKTISPICEVWLGPKCQAEEKWIEVFLATEGIKNVKIQRSKATYR